ncbi:DUF3298 and DUF4163 domain-containing protein [Intestinibacter bartlettii]|uniref:DUF3298 and DUF4163 domain-containing protein n=1 Tax=Intestinibacter bartlettii TaxID=261299 RepID=A0ABS6DVC7_9FIRM|nr:DUF3298 and DUF4163 domain-containing protein [Intestinibacter bartlettii]MBU5335783.1 DUF3298 and DUF4163 domain-containing protein [Intestinibacter bartlettii]
MQLIIMNQISPNFTGCIYNLLYIQYNEIFGREEYFYFDLAYPVFFNVKNGYFQVDKQILNTLNETVYSNVDTFRNSLYEEMAQYNKTAAQNALPKRVYQVNTTYDITFSKNHVLSFVLNLDSISDNYGPLYEDVYHFNIDLLTGNTLTLKDLFNEGVDYIQLLSDFVNNEITKTPTLFYEGTVVEIPDSQAFYITDKGIVLFFEIDEIASQSAGVPKFLVSFEEFGQYINPRFYCNPQNILRRKKRR